MVASIIRINGREISDIAEDQMIAEETTKGIFAEVEDALMIAVIQARTTTDDLDRIVIQAMTKITEAAVELCG